MLNRPARRWPRHPQRPLLLALLLGVLAAPFAGRAAAELPEGFRRGVSHAHVHRGDRGYGTEVAARELAALKALGVEWVALTPFGYQQRATDDRVTGYKGRGRDLNTDALAAEVRQAHRLGLKVLLKPHIWSRDFWSGQAWHGSIHPPDAAARARWWRSYRAMTLHFARLAERESVELFCLGTELVRMTAGRGEAWRELIGDVRAVYSGPLTYAAHWDEELASISFWPQLDAIGVAAYFPLEAPAEPSLRALVEAWQPHIDRLERLHERHDRPVLFLEVGYRPDANTHLEPWRYEIEVPDEKAQARAYEAMFRALGDRPWWRGAFLWKTFTDPARGRRDAFAFRHREAEKVIRRWYTPHAP